MAKKSTEKAVTTEDVAETITLVQEQSTDTASVETIINESSADNEEATEEENRPMSEPEPEYTIEHYLDRDRFFPKVNKRYLYECGNTGLIEETKSVILAKWYPTEDQARGAIKAYIERSERVRTILY